MEKIITTKNEFNSLDTLLTYLNLGSSFECSKEYDQWEHRTDASGQMEQCLVLKKNGMHAVKLFFENENKLNVTYIIPNKLMNAYFGKSEKRYRNIFEIVSGKIKNVVLAAPQKKAFNELVQVVEKAAV